MFRRLSAALAALFLGSSALGARQQLPIFSSGATGVRVDVLVTDHGVPVTGLRAADFALKDDGVGQVVNVVESSDAPFNVALTFDTSGSTEGKRTADLTDAGRALIAGLRSADRVALITFSHAVVERVPLTEDLARVSAALGALTPSGQTSIMDGVYAAMMTTQSEPGRSFVIVCTDGRDTQSWLQPDEVTEAAKRSNAVIYAVVAGAARRWQALKGLAEVTGGHMIEIEKTSDFREQLVRALQEFRSRYVLTFTPQGVGATGFHRLDVRVTGHPGLIVQARSGYVRGGGQP